MRIVTENKSKKSLVLFCLVFAILMLLNTKVYAIKITYYTKNIIVGETQDFFVSGEKQTGSWILETQSNNGIIRTTKVGSSTIKCTGLKEGKAKFGVLDSKTRARTSIEVSVIPAPSTLSVYRGNLNSNQKQPVIVDFEGKWKISSKYGWTVFSPNVGIIEVTDYGYKDGILKFKAKRSDISYISGNPGLTYIDIKEKKSGDSQRYWIQVKPYVTKIKIGNYYPYVSVGDVKSLKAITYPQNYANLAQHGKIEWKSTVPKIATVSNGLVSFHSEGNVAITAKYSDGKHESVIDYVTYNVKKRESDLKISRGLVDDIVVCEDDKDDLKCWENVIPGQSRTWYITSRYGWYYIMDNNSVIQVSRNGNYLTYRAINTGSVKLSIIEEKTKYKRDFTIFVKNKKSTSQASNNTRHSSSTSTINIDRHKDNNIVKDNEEYIVQGCSRTWNIKNSNGGWSPYSKDIRLITVRWDSQNGVLTYTANDSGRTGDAEITITEKGTGKKFTYTIHVVSRVTKIKITNMNKITPYVGSSAILTAETGPLNYVGKKGYGSIEWKSSRPEVAEINPKTGEIKFKQPSKTTEISVIYSDGVHRIPSDPLIISPLLHENLATTLKIDRNTDNVIIFSNIEKISDNTIIDGKEYIIGDFSRTWKVSSNYGWFVSEVRDPSKAIKSLKTDKTLLTYTVNDFSSCNMKSAYITITEKRTGIKKTFQINVEPAVKDLKLKLNNNLLHLGNVQKLNFETLPVNYVGKEKHGVVTYTSLDTSKAVINKLNGIIQACKPGTVTIQMTYSDGLHKITRDFTIKITEFKVKRSEAYYETYKKGVEVDGKHEYIIQGFTSLPWQITSSKKGWTYEDSEKNKVIQITAQKNSLTYYAKTVGNTKLTITDRDTGLYETFYIHVIPKIDSLSLVYSTLVNKNQSKIEVKTGPFATLGHDTLFAYDSNITIKSLNEDVVTVYRPEGCFWEANLIWKKPGIANIEICLYNNNKKTVKQEIHYTKRLKLQEDHKHIIDPDISKKY